MHINCFVNVVINLCVSPNLTIYGAELASIKKEVKARLKGPYEEEPHNLN
jgi:hypothetical protein